MGEKVLLELIQTELSQQKSEATLIVVQGLTGSDVSEILHGYVAMLCIEDIFKYFSNSELFNFNTRQSGQDLG